MPITTPQKWAERHYQGDHNHFNHILEHLFVPAVKAAGFNPIRPSASGADIIQATIIEQLAEADLVLCDMSTLNPNVFYEHGIRTALNKPVALIADDKTQNLPFDTAVINFHKYKGDALQAFNLKNELECLTKHIQKSADSSNNVNTLWKYFGITTPSGDFNKESASTEDGLRLLTTEVAALRNIIIPNRYKSPLLSDLEIKKTCNNCLSEMRSGSDFCDNCGTGV